MSVTNRKPPRPNSAAISPRPPSSSSVPTRPSPLRRVTTGPAPMHIYAAPPNPDEDYTVTWKWLLGLIAITSILSIVGFYGGYALSSFRPEFGNPFLKRHPSPFLRHAAHDLFDTTRLDETLWGTYRSSLYFGMRTKLPRSLLTGLAWFDPHRGLDGAFQSIRHTARQEDALRQYGWTAHDGVSYGVHEVRDGGSRAWEGGGGVEDEARRKALAEQQPPFLLKTTMVKNWTAASGPGGDWAVRIELLPDQDAPSSSSSASSSYPTNRVVSLLLYMQEELLAEGGQRIRHEDVKMFTVPGDLDQGGRLAYGKSNDLGHWALHLSPPRNPSSSSSSSSSESCLVDASRLGEMYAHTHNVTDRIKQHLASYFLQRQQEHRDDPSSSPPPSSLLLPNHVESGTKNFVAIQLDVTLPCRFDVVFVSGIDQSTPSHMMRYLETTRKEDKEDKGVSGLSGMVLDGLRGGKEVNKGGGEGRVGSVAVRGGDASVGEEERVRRLLSPLGVDALIEQGSQRFEEHLARTLPHPSETCPASSSTSSTSSCSTPLSSQVYRVARDSLSNLIGSVGYFFGRSRVETPKRDGSTKTDLYFSSPLLTATPSRSFFPRGFLWDEGFHQLVMSRFDTSLSREILGHWLDLVSKAGWIPREQILGTEARARVPDEFVPQRPLHANPPTLLLPLHALADMALSTDHKNDATTSETERNVTIAFLKMAYPRAKTWFNWLDASQRGGESDADAKQMLKQARAAGVSSLWPPPSLQKEEGSVSYYWHGRDVSTDRELNPKTLTSGLDDYPRASHPSPHERHVDLRCWLTMGAASLEAIARAIGSESSEVQVWHDFQARVGNWTDVRRVHRAFHGEHSGMLLDFGLHSEHVVLKRRVSRDGVAAAPDNLIRLLRDGAPPPTLQHVPHYGYNSLLPLIAGLVPVDSVDLGEQLALLRREDLLWTPFGLRSLAASSSLYNAKNTAHDAPYWRGAIWINMNYLVLRSLDAYRHAPGPHARLADELYVALRSNVMNNVASEYERTGFVWEQYDDGTGRGRGSHPFTGWSALVSLMASEDYRPTLRLNQS